MNSTMKQSHSYKALTSTQHSNQMIYSMNAQSKRVFAKSKLYSTGKKIIQASNATRYNTNKQNESSLSKFSNAYSVLGTFTSHFLKLWGQNSNFGKLVINSYSYNLLTPH